MKRGITLTILALLAGLPHGDLLAHPGNEPHDDNNPAHETAGEAEKSAAKDDANAEAGETAAADAANKKAEAKTAEAKKAGADPYFEFCRNNAGKAVSITATTGIDTFARAAKLRRGRKSVMYNQDLLPEAPAEVRLFLFARECGVFAKSVPADQSYSAEEHRQLDCWATKTLHKNALLSTAQVDGVGQYLNALSDEDWGHITGGKHKNDLMSCLAPAAVEAAANPQAKTQAKSQAKAEEKPACKNKKVVRKQVGTKEIATLEAQPGGKQNIHPLLYFMPAPPKQTVKKVPIYEYVYECVD